MLAAPYDHAHAVANQSSTVSILIALALRLYNQTLTTTSWSTGSEEGLARMMGAVEIIHIQRYTINQQDS
jgi:hypothetical protein